MDRTIKTTMPQAETSIARSLVLLMSVAIAAVSVGCEVDQIGPERVEDASPAEVAAKRDVASYTKFVVDEAIALYGREGLDAVVSYANDSGNIEDQWYLFVIDENDSLIGHYDPERRNLDVKGWVGTDINGFVFGNQMLTATEDGKWVGYVYRNPAVESDETDITANFELKNAWVVRHDGLIFGSGWYINVDEFMAELVDEIGHRLGTTGFESTIAYYSDPQKLTKGLEQTVAYYNSAENVVGNWLAFYVEPDGTVLFNSDADSAHGNIADLLGSAVLDADASGAWITEADNPVGEGPASMKIRHILQGDVIFGAGWYSG